MTSVLAGEYRLEDVSFEESTRILRHIGMGKPTYCKEPLLPQELTGAYSYVLFGNKPNAACVPLVHEATSSEKKANKKLLRARLTVDCPRKPEGGCAQCLIGKDQCGIACRMFTKDQNMTIIDTLEDRSDEGIAEQSICSLVMITADLSKTAESIHGFVLYQHLPGHPPLLFSKYLGLCLHLRRNMKTFRNIV